VEFGLDTKDHAPPGIQGHSDAVHESLPVRARADGGSLESAVVFPAVTTPTDSTAPFTLPRARTRTEIRAPSSLIATLTATTLVTATLYTASCSTARVTEDAAILSLGPADQESRLALVNEVMARYRFTPVANQGEAWIEEKQPGNSELVQVRRFERAGSGARKACSANLSLVREQLRITLQGSNCPLRPGTIAESLRAAWRETASPLELRSLAVH
jgi:hypothetical protein